jgi:hypothetical protein
MNGVNIFTTVKIGGNIAVGSDAAQRKWENCNSLLAAELKFNAFLAALVPREYSYSGAPVYWYA